MSTSQHTETTATETELFTGRVKWFNNKAGYGFITITDGEKNGSDIFVHHSNIDVDKEQYKYLVQGEYVEFQLQKMSSGNHEYQATGVCGIKNGQLMCETRHQMNVQRVSYRQQKGQTAEPTSVPPPQSQKKVVPKLNIPRSRGPRDGETRTRVVRKPNQS